VREFADSDWSSAWSAVRTVSASSGQKYRIPGRPWHFADTVGPMEDQIVPRQGENNAEILADLGFDEAQIADLVRAGVTVEAPRTSEGTERG
jgi:crotonobetainyl-CoA:carnitine CoA-transferase CaiB-like acyl-CoA transferase